MAHVLGSALLDMEKKLEFANNVLKAE